MTTKIKIIIGFLLMVILLGGVSWVGYNDLQATVSDFREYNRIASFNTNLSDLDSSLNLFESEVYQYLDKGTKENMDNAAAALNTTFNELDTADTLVKLPERVARLRELREFAQSLKVVREKVYAANSEVIKQYEEVMQPSNRALGSKLLAIAHQAMEVDNPALVYASAQALEQLAAARSGVSRFAQTKVAEDAAKVKGYAGALGDLVHKLEPLIRTDAGRQAYADVLKALDESGKAFEVMTKNASDLQKNLSDISGILQKSTAIANALNKSVDVQTAKMSEEIQADTAKAQSILMIACVAGVLLGVLIAAYIIIGLIRVLNNLAGFAGAVAKGDFSYTVKVREKGEIGAMIDSMREIPRVLDSVINQANALADKISSGHLRDRLDEKTFHGSFAILSRGINVVGDAYTGLLDALSLPVMACDKDNSIIFLNQIAQAALGGNYTKEQCRGHLNAKECGGKDCYGACAMSKNAPHSGETTIKVRGKNMEVSVAAFPLHNLKHEVVGYVEILTDLTDIKDRQNMVLKVAAEASEISDRVAAASEELAAQVEQISRGAELQRSRVESTASAMTEMNATVLEVARSAGQASEQSEGTRHKAEGGAGLVNKVVHSINQVNTVAVTLQDNMQELGKQAESIGGVMNVISDIADQTNLLALNAAIEAARAGEAGRGFAVVADEVRKLAEKTMVATQEVGANISAIQNSAKSNISEVSSAVKSISEATDLANSSGAALKEIVDLAAANSAVVASIATAAEEQSATSEEINRSIEEISHVVGETTDGMVQSSAAVQDLSRMAQELRQVMERLK